jgi:60 kDa SS-A/Ro ribonucleoprotein
MVNKNLFKTGSTTPAVPAADTQNNAGGKAYKFDKKHCLAQIAATNCFNGTFYASADSNLKLAKDAVEALKDDPEFIAKVAVYSRDKGYMKDMPAYLCAVLAGLDKKLFRKVFRKVIDNGKMLRNVIQIARSGQAGKVYNMSSGTFRHALQEWFDNKSPASIFKASIGNDPSMRDILRMARPAPRNQQGEYSADKAALFAYLLDAELKDGEFLVYKGKGSERKVAYRHAYNNLPELVLQYEAYKKDKSLPVPNVDFRFLDHLVDDKGWATIAENAGWTMTRMNLNTFQRHNVFASDRMVRLIAARLQSKEEIVKAKAFPYQLLMAYKATEGVPALLVDALQEAMEIATENAPVFQGQSYIAVDVSGSMGSPITGHQPGGVSSKVRCVDVASLFAATVLRKNRTAQVLPFDTRIHSVSDLNARDSIMTNANKLARYGGGGTNCALALEHLNQQNAKGDAVVFISDNESWVDSPRYSWSGGTGMLTAWAQFKKRNPRARLVCIDLIARDNSQVKAHEDILQVGGFSDQVFEVVNSFLEHGHSADHWVSVIEGVSLD